MPESCLPNLRFPSKRLSIWVSFARAKMSRLSSTLPRHGFAVRSLQECEMVHANQTEAAFFLKSAVGEANESNSSAVAASLLAKGVQGVVLKLGKTASIVQRAVPLASPFLRFKSRLSIPLLRETPLTADSLPASCLARRSSRARALHPRLRNLGYPCRCATLNAAHG